MARILICHVPKDGSVARDLGAMLMGRGHYVSFDGEPDTPRSDRFARLRQFEAVVVVWTDYSVASAGLSEIARETLPLNLLVPLRADNVPASSLPLIFRKLNMLSPRDFEGVARFVARLSTAASSLKEMAARDALMREARAQERPQTEEKAPSPPVRPRAVPPVEPRKESVAVEKATLAAPVGAQRMQAVLRPLALPDVSAVARDQDGTADEPVPKQLAPPPGAPPQAPQPTLPPFVRQDPPAAPVASAQDLARMVDAGLIATRIPAAMWHIEPTTVEILLNRQLLVATELGVADRPGRLGPQLGERGLIETLSISLYGEAGVFEIERQSERTQFVHEQRSSTRGRDARPYGRWVWMVTPLAPGDHDLVLRISALMRDRHGVPTPVALPDRHYPIVIHGPEGATQPSSVAGWTRR